MSSRRGFMKLFGMGAAGAAAAAALPLPASASAPAGVAAEVMTECPACNHLMRHSRLNSNDPVDVMNFCDRCGFVMVLPTVQSEQVMALKRGFVKPLIKKDNWLRKH